MEDKEKFRRNTRVFQGILTQSSAKFAEKMRANFYENKFLLVIRACLKIEEMWDFCPKMVDSRKKRNQTDVWRGFLTQKMTVLG